MPIFGGGNPNPVAQVASQGVFAFANNEVNTFAKDNEGIVDEAVARMSMDLKPTITMARPDVISMYFTQIADAAGAHAYGGHFSHSFGMTKTGARKLLLRDLFTQDSDTDTIVLSVVIGELRKRGPSNEALVNKLMPQLLTSWVITPAGITVFFDAGTLDSYAAGDTVVKCSWADLDKVTEAGRLSPFARKIAGAR